MSRYLLSFITAFLVSLIGTFAVRAIACRLGLVARPRADRWHRRPTALFGGVAIYLGVFGTYLCAGRPGDPGSAAVLLLCSSGMFLLGLVDDWLRLKPYAKLIFQIIGAALFTRYGLRLHWLPSVVLDEGLTIFWLVGVTNALNLLDNIDGLAGGVAAIGALFLVYLCATEGDPAHAVLAAALCGAAGGFLVFNFNPASIFMGDCGSLFLGFLLGSLALVNTQAGGRRNLLAVLLVPVLLLLLPIVDTTLVTISRKLAGRAISAGGRDHTSHRLVALGLSERAATLTLWALAALSGAVAVLLRNLPPFIGLGLVGLFVMALLFVMVFLGQVQVYGPAGPSQPTRRMTFLPTLAGFTYKRRVFEVASDLVFVLLSYYLAFLLRFDGILRTPFYEQFITSVPVVICVQLATFLSTGLYRGLWRYTGIGDLLLQVRSVLLAMCLSAFVVLLAFRFTGFSRAVFVIDGMLLLLCVAGSRLSFRLMHAWVQRRRRREGARRVLIYGAGERGELVLRELQGNLHARLVPIGFIDDDPQKSGRSLHGLRVLGSVVDLPAILQEERVAEVVVSTPTLLQDRFSHVQRICTEAGAALRRMRISLE